MDWQKDSLDIASWVSSILLELCELEVFLLSWPGPSQSSSPGSSPGIYSSVAEAALAIALEGISCELAVMLSNEKSSLYSGNH